MPRRIKRWLLTSGLTALFFAVFFAISYRAFILKGEGGSFWQWVWAMVCGQQ